MANKVYKIVTVQGDARKSATTTGKSSMLYVPHEWTKRTYWGPFVFDSIYHVRLFLEGARYLNGYPIEIWECSARRVRRAPLHIAYAPEYSAMSADDLKKARRLMKLDLPPIKYRYHFAPTGSLIAESIKLDKRVDWNIDC